MPLVLDGMIPKSYQLVAKPMSSMFSSASQLQMNV
jgi:hypothetical protein